MDEISNSGVYRFAVAQQIRMTLTPQQAQALLRREARNPAAYVEGGVPLHEVRDLLGHSNISQTSIYLAGTGQTKHDAMTRYWDQEAALQPMATDDETGGQTGTSTATTEDKKSNETTVGHQATIM